MAACGQIRRAEVGDTGDTSQLGDHGAFADLNRIPLLRRMPDGLSVGADNADGLRRDPRLCRHGQSRFGIQLAQPHIHFTHLVHGGQHRIEETEDSLPGILGVGQIQESQQLHRQTSVRPVPRSTASAGPK
ncbi:hypothetical protein D3C75_974950 [compost metagenome]